MRIRTRIASEGDMELSLKCIMLFAKQTARHRQFGACNVLFEVIVPSEAMVCTFMSNLVDTFEEHRVVKHPGIEFECWADHNPNEPDSTFEDPV